MRSERESETDRGGGSRRELYLFNLEGSEMQASHAGFPLSPAGLF